MQELGNAINEALSDSERIAEAIGDIRQSGYDVFLVLEATIGFNKRDESDEEQSSHSSSSAAMTATESAAPKKTRHASTGKIKLTSQDQKFLRALKISVEDEG
jgi:hypothetical protein